MYVRFNSELLNKYLIKNDITIKDFAYINGIEINRLEALNNGNMDLMLSDISKIAGAINVSVGDLLVKKSTFSTMDLGGSEYN